MGYGTWLEILYSESQFLEDSRGFWANLTRLFDETWSFRQFRIECAGQSWKYFPANPEKILWRILRGFFANPTRILESTLREFWGQSWEDSRSIRRLFSGKPWEDSWPNSKRFLMSILRGFWVKFRDNGLANSGRVHIPIRTGPHANSKRILGSILGVFSRKDFGGQTRDNSLKNQNTILGTIARGSSGKSWEDSRVKSRSIVVSISRGFQAIPRESSGQSWEDSGSNLWTILWQILRRFMRQYQVNASANP